MNCEPNDLWVGAILGVGVVAGLMIVIFCAAATVWIRSIGRSLIEISAITRSRCYDQETSGFGHGSE